MKVRIPKVVIAVPMSGYSPELEGSSLMVWVNPPLEKLQEYSELVTDLQQTELEVASKTLLGSGGEAVAVETPSAGVGKVLSQLRRWLAFKKGLPVSELDPRMLAWYAEAWSQGGPDTRWTVEELQQLERQDPAFLSWMISQTWEVRREHMERKKKA